MAAVARRGYAKHFVLARICYVNLATCATAVSAFLPARAFAGLDKLLSGRHTAAEMKGVLRRSPAQIRFRIAKACHAFLKRIRELME